MFLRWHSPAGVVELSILRDLEGTVMNDDGHDSGHDEVPDDLKCPECDSYSITDFAYDPMKYQCESCGAIFHYSPGNEF